MFLTVAAVAIPLSSRAAAAASLIVSHSLQHTMTMSASSSSSSTVFSRAREKGLFLRTPLVHSIPLSKLCHRPVYLKLDLLQPSGSFKDRGMAYLCERLLETKGRDNTRLISSSGGNAGLAVTMVACQKLGMNVDVIVPKTTKSMVIEKLQSLGAQVTVYGNNWNEADTLARELVDKDPNAEYISPYDNSLLWTGHSSLVDELMEEQYLVENNNLGAIVASVGGGGLLCGIFEGMERHYHSSSCTQATRVIPCETEGAASFAKAWQLFQDTPTSTSTPPPVVRLERIDSIATSLGALEVTPVSLTRAKAHDQNSHGGSVIPSICTDAEAVDACLKFATDHRMLVEPACGAALAVVYSERLRNVALNGVVGPVVVEVCGGSGVTLDLLQMWKQELLL